MKKPSEFYVGKVRDCLKAYWLDNQQENKTPFSYYRDRFSLNTAWTEIMVKETLDLPESPDDKFVMAMIEKVAKSKDKGARRGEFAPAAAPSTPAPVVTHIRRDASDLSKYQPRELIAELRKRGYKGKLYYTQEISV